MADGRRALERKATIEIQRRPGRAGTVTGAQRRQPGGGGGDAGATAAPGDALSNPSNVPAILNDVYTPDGFDEKSTVLACNFPPGVSINQCRVFFSWIGPVVRVDRAPSVTQESNFVVVFATTEHAHSASTLSLVYDEGDVPIYTRMIAEKDTLWKKVSGYFTSVSTQSELEPAPAGGVGESLSSTAGAASAWLSTAGEKTGSALASAGNTISTKWNESGATEAFGSAAESVNEALSKATGAVQGYVA